MTTQNSAENTESRFDIPTGKLEAGKDLTGKIQDTLGTGQNAKDSMVYLFLKWILLGTLLILLFPLFSLYVHWYEKDILERTTDSVVKIISVVAPILTLLLGYAFGKSKS